MLKLLLLCAFFISAPLPAAQCLGDKRQEEVLHLLSQERLVQLSKSLGKEDFMTEVKKELAQARWKKGEKEISPRKILVKVKQTYKECLEKGPAHFSCAPTLSPQSCCHEGLKDAQVTVDWGQKQELLLSANLTVFYTARKGKHLNTAICPN